MSAPGSGAETLARKVRHELVEYGINVVYLMLVLLTITVYRRLLLAAREDRPPLLSTEEHGMSSPVRPTAPRCVAGLLRLRSAAWAPYGGSWRLARWTALRNNGYIVLRGSAGL
jgi:hypothetical protein